MGTINMSQIDDSALKRIKNYLTQYLDVALNLMEIELAGMELFSDPGLAEFMEKTGMAKHARTSSMLIQKEVDFFRTQVEIYKEYFKDLKFILGQATSLDDFTKLAEKMEKMENAYSKRQATTI